MKFIFGPFWVSPLHEVQQRSSPTRPTELTHQKPRTNPPADPLGNSNNPNSPNNSNTPKTQTTQCTPSLSHSSSSSHFHCFHLSIVFSYDPPFFTSEFSSVLHMFVSLCFSIFCFSANAHLCVPIFLMFLIWTSPKSTPVCPSYYSYLKNSSHF